VRSEAGHPWGQQGPTISGPIRKGEQIHCTIDWDGHEARLIIDRAMRRLGSP
jgi:hypothetical protein